MRVDKLSDAELHRALYATLRDLRVLVENFDSFSGLTRVFALGSSAGLASYAQSLESEAQRRQKQVSERRPRTRIVRS